MSIDWRWMSNGGVLMDGQGDIALTTDPLESVIDITRSRLKASLNGWKLYRIGADLQSRIGSLIDAELESSICRQVSSCLSNNFLSVGTFSVSALSDGSKINVYVYLQDQLIITAVLDRDSGLLSTALTN